MPLDANHIGKLLDVLGAAAQGQDWPTRMQLPDAVDELSLWIEDERQWARAWPRNWKSLMEDVIASAAAFGPATQAAANVPDLLRELKGCRSLLSTEETRGDPALRRRVRGVVETTRERFQRNETLVAAWADVAARVENREAAEIAARQLLALGAWCGHGRKALSEALQAELRKAPTVEQAIAAAAGFLHRPARRAHMVVWLRYLLAPTKEPLLALGDSVRLYSEAWLNECLEHAPDHPDAPPEARDDEHEFLKMFCQKRSDEDDPERPVTYVRIDLGDELVARAVTVARDTAEAIASLGIIYGSEPSIWRLDDGDLLYADGEATGSSVGPPVVEQPTFDQRMAVRRDRTIAGLADVADKFGPLLPVRDPGVHAAATLLGWLREARRAGGPLQLVLFDRVIESASGWAGINSMSRFIQDELIPWWAYNRIRNAIQVAGLEAIWAGGGRYPAGSPERRAQSEILQHPPLEASIGGEGTSLNLQGVLTETAWLLERVPADSAAHRRLSDLARRTRTGESTADWWTDLTKQANRLEARRLRTRNALTHGGPLAAATIEGVARFGEHLAGEALAACVEGRLLKEDLIDYFLRRNRRIANIRADLQAGADSAHALFWEY
jgi:hypothetical protein